MLAAIRPDDWNLPLLVHVLGAMVLVGAVVTALSVQALGWRRQSPAAATSYARLAFRTLLFVALPAWFVMRIGAQWIESKEGLGDEPAWLGIGYITAEGGGLFLLIGIILSGVGARRLRRGGGERSIAGRIATVLVAVALVMFVVAVWAMSAKPE